MKLTMVGGGGFRVPRLFEALAGDPDSPITELTLVDADVHRLDVIRSVIDAMRTGSGAGPAVSGTTNLHCGLRDADFVFCAIRVGGTACRAIDERIALENGVLGQETIGIGGLAYALRTVPVARTLAHMIAEQAPNAWTVNYSNPAGIITEAMREVLGERVVGVCDTPGCLIARVGAALGQRIDSADYVGINHLGWLRAALADGVDRLPSLLADDDALAALPEARTFGADFLRSMGAVPNEYLSYFYFTRESVRRLRGGRRRGAWLHTQQSAFYDAAGERPDHALGLWRAALAAREESYHSVTRADPNPPRPRHEIARGGYQRVALDLMHRLCGRDAPGEMVLNVANAEPGRGRVIGQLADDAVVEVPCMVDTGGVHPLPVPPVSDEMAGLMLRVKACDSLVLAATAERREDLALRAFAAHPLVDSLNVARSVLSAYTAQMTTVANAIGR